ncbi:DUF4123 domain-containing protein [Chromohalobacter nigrandesensis]|uniref:DUF4123 domain-containing protein n=1 Tax=Chromohalobacter nigrandesensis TaxID=119863 RepID=UPI001FF110CE|nr:DUF4123 domain-containing protein [Chromohalobacter nigrandesensis]MCK0746730.1 DUF4123 domain-containing protein [Chromohalobacter nigrandesensis]
MADAFDPQWLMECQYALLNPLRVEKADMAGLSCQPLKTPSVKVRDHLLPQLVCLEMLSHTQRESLLPQLMRYQRRGDCLFSALLQSDAPPEDILQHFRFTLEQTRWGSRQKWWLRYYDPAVFQHLCWLLDESQMNRLLGPIKCWHWPAPHEHWSSLAGCQVEKPTINMPLLSDEQWAAIDRVAMLNTTLGRLNMLAPEWTTTFENCRWLDRLLEEAHSHFGMTDPDDRRLYAEQAARFHPRIHDHPALQRHLDEVRETEARYSFICENLSATDMHTMALELKEST